MLGQNHGYIGSNIMSLFIGDAQAPVQLVNGQMVIGKFRIFIIIFLNGLDIKAGAFMKKTIFISSLILLLFIGCSSTYKISDFPSKEKYFEDFNVFANDKILNACFSNNNSCIQIERAKLLNDTLYFFSTIDNAVVKMLPLNEIKEISYKNHWTGLPIHLVIGTAAGIMVGGTSAFVYDKMDKNDKNATDYDIFWGVTAIGLITGGIIGWINGYTYVYEFNP